MSKMTVPFFLFASISSQLIAACASEEPPPTLEECPPPSDTTEIAPQYYGSAAGIWPVWAIFGKPELIFSMDEIMQAPLQEHGYPNKVLWVIEKDYSGEITLQGGNLKDRTPLWFQMGGDKPTTNPTLDPLNPGAYSNPQYSDFPSYLFMPGPGCYFLRADWQDGNWQIYITVTE